MDMISGTRCSGSEIEVILVASEADHQAVEDWKSSSEELFLIMNDEECTGNDERHIYGYVWPVQILLKPFTDSCKGSRRFKKSPSRKSHSSLLWLLPWRRRNGMRS